MPGFDDHFAVFLVAPARKLTGTGPAAAPFVLTSCPEDFRFSVRADAREIRLSEPKRIRKALRGGMSRPLPEDVRAVAQGGAERLSFRKVSGPSSRTFDSGAASGFRAALQSKGYAWAVHLGGSSTIYEDDPKVDGMEFVGCINPGNLIDSLDQVALALFWDGQDGFEQRLLFEM